MSKNSTPFSECVGLAILGAVVACVIFYLAPIMPVIGPWIASSNVVQMIGWLNALGGAIYGLKALTKIKGGIAAFKGWLNDKSQSQSKSKETPGRAQDLNVKQNQPQKETAQQTHGNNSNKDLQYFQNKVSNSNPSHDAKIN